MAPLPGTRKEAKGIAKLLQLPKKRVRLGNAANEVALKQAKTAFASALPDLLAGRDAQPVASSNGNGAGLDHGAVVIAAITSCTNTSNPSVMIAAGLLAQKAVARGLKPQP